MQLRLTYFSLQAFVKLEFMRSEKIISNWYEVQRNQFTLVGREHIFANLNSQGMISNLHIMSFVNV